jgi:hypothetical protein
VIENGKLIIIYFYLFSNLFRIGTWMAFSQNDSKHCCTKMLVQIGQSETDHAGTLPLSQLTGNG